MAVAVPSAKASSLLRLRCRVDTWSEALEYRWHKLLCRGVGLANKICAATRLPRIHQRLAVVRAWHEPVPLVEPIFIVGDERSGTTILGQVLGCQGDVLFLNEPRPVWNRAAPDLDQTRFRWVDGKLWGRYYVDETDVTMEAKASLEYGFGWAMRLAGRHRLLEKLPFNLFRVRWLHAMWADAKFIQIIRDPFSTAASKTECWPSIHEKKIAGIAIRKRVYVALFPELSGLLDSVQGAYEFYLFECRICIELGERLKGMFPRAYHLLRLEDLQTNPESTLASICAFAGLRFSNRLRRAYRTMLDRRVRLATPPIDPVRCRELLGDSAKRWGYELTT
jgi:hypothetical protein